MMRVLTREEVAGQWEAIKSDDRYRVIDLAKTEDEVRQAKRFKHDVNGALRTLRYIADKSLDIDDPNYDRKKDILAKHLYTLDQLVRLLNEIDGES